MKKLNLFSVFITLSLLFISFNSVGECGCDIRTGEATRKFRWEDDSGLCCNTRSGRGKVEVVQTSTGEVMMSYEADISRLQAQCCRIA